MSGNIKSFYLDGCNCEKISFWLFITSILGNKVQIYTYQIIAIPNTIQEYLTKFHHTQCKWSTQNLPYRYNKLMHVLRTDYWMIYVHIILQDNSILHATNMHFTKTLQTYILVNSAAASTLWNIYIMPPLSNILR